MISSSRTGSTSAERSTCSNRSAASRFCAASRLRRGGWNCIFAVAIRCPSADLTRVQPCLSTLARPSAAVASSNLPERPCEMQAAAFRLADRSQQPRRSTGKIAPGTQERRKRHKGLRPPVLFSADAELGEQRQVIGGDQGLAAAMQQELLQHKVTIEVHVVQVHDREHSGVSATAVEVELNVDALKLTL